MYQPVFREPPQNWRQWWTCLRRFAAGWWERPEGTVGQRTEEAQRLERDLGRNLSPAIFEWSAFHADRLGFPRDDHDFGWNDELQAVTLLIQGEHDRYWGILPEHLELDDPPVHAWALDHFGKGGAWHAPTAWSPTTTAFALNHLINYLNAPAGRLQTWVSTDEAAQITEDLTAAMATRFELDDTVLFEDIDAIARIQPRRYQDPDEPKRLDIAVHLGDRWSFTLPPSIETLVPRSGGVNGYFWTLREGTEEPKLRFPPST
jgi:hypothetical protein